MRRMSQISWCSTNCSWGSSYRCKSPPPRNSNVSTSRWKPRCMWRIFPALTSISPCGDTRDSTRDTPKGTGHMKRSTHRILTKPVGSLHRPRSLEEMMVAHQRGETPVDAQVLAVEIRAAVANVVAMQVACGMDYVSDGEMAKL